MCLKRLRTILFLLGFLVIPVAAFAHPVVFITFKIQFTFNSSGLEGFNELWRFDQVHSEQILQMFDTNHNGKIDPSELPALERGYFDDLKDYSYFTSIVVDGKEVPTKTVADFSATYEDHRMVYRFFVPLKVPIAASDQEVDVTLWDPTYFTDLSPEGDHAITVSKPNSIEATISVANDHRHFYHLAPDLVLVKAPPFYLRMQVVRFRAGG